MDVHFDRRAMVAIRSLDPMQRNHVEGIVESLAGADGSNWRQVVEVKPLRVMDGQQLFSVSADNELRLLTKVIAGALIVQDVFARERLEQIAGMAL